ncbi:MAG: leucine-rich repeat domain-containing protein [Candidatus Lokiarchaeota archaeon]|nr:leucine-rich repeat domain-containing protein [Candidatus Lokiarchaeota archaeon]
MILTPNKIFESFRSQVIDKSKTVDLLITLIETLEDDEVREKSIYMLNKIDIQHNKVFKILENIFLSDSNGDLRYAAARVIKNKFLNKALSPFLWALKFESSYNCLVCIIKSLEEISDNKIKAVLINEIKKVSIEPFKESLSPLIIKNEIEGYSNRKLAEILINHITIFSLKKKFNKLNYKAEKGLIVSLDLSNIDDLVIDWHYREMLKDCSDIIGIHHLTKLNSLKLFPLKWVINNELTFTNALALVKALEGLNNDAAKKALISEIEKIEDRKFLLSIKSQLKAYNSLENLSTLKLSNIYRNFILISFLKKKYKNINYELVKGEVVKLQIEGEAVITLPEFVSHLSSLTSLILKNCNLYSLPHSIGTFRDLKFLNLEGNNLTSLPKSIRNLQSLQNFDISRNKFANLPNYIGKLSSLEDLNVENNYLVILPKSIGALSFLKHMNVSRNKLIAVPDSIGSLKLLKSLILYSNKIEILPDSIGLLQSLEILDLDKNMLEEVPDTIGSLSLLKVLKLEENALISLPEPLNHLKSLEHLNVSWNKLENFPNFISSLSLLKTLQLSHNKLKNIPNAVRFLSSLENLIASQNEIKLLPEFIGNLTSLKVLKLSDNSILNIPNSIVSLCSLEILDLCGNEIERVPEKIGELKSLKVLYLNGNRLKNLPLSLKELKSLKILSITGNKFTKLPEFVLKMCKI